MRLIMSLVEEAMKSGRNRKYTEQFRTAAVEQVLVGRRGLREVARSLEMSDKTLANWVGKARKGEALVKRGPRPPVTDLEAENARLKQENARLRMEKEIMKKAVARSTGRCNTFWSNVGPGGKASESEEKMRAIACTEDVVVAEMERW